MKTSTVLSLAVSAVGLTSLWADDLPKQFAFARYETMTNRSPFAIATAATPPPQAPNFAKDLYIANAAKLASESVVTLASNVDKNMKEYLSTKEPNKGGYSISNIEWSDRVGATKVTITKDGQFATLTFNQALLSQPVAGGQPQPQIVQPQINNVISAVPTPVPQVMPGVANPIPTVNHPGGIKPAPVPMLPTPPPRVRGVIQRNPNVPGQPVPDDRAQLQQQEQ